jgi:molybdopterin-guanine dinucleotide biosynthesis protein A
MIKEKKRAIISVIILAGGKSSRIGLDKDKGHMPLSGTNLIDQVISNIVSLKGISEQDIIIVGPKEKFLNYKYKRVIEDIFPEKGPLGGIFSGLKYSTTFYNLVIGYDMPFIETKLIEYMIQNRNNYDLVLPTHSGGLSEPLCAIYSKNCLEIIEKNLKSDELAIRYIFPFLKIRWIREEEIKRFDPELNSFFNINLISDFGQAEKLERKRRSKDC